MKLSATFFLTIFVVSISNAQFSGKLDSVVFFKSIQFGQTITKDFFKGCSGVDIYANEYRLIYNDLDTNCKLKYADLFNLYGTSFSNVSIQTNEKSQVFSIIIWSLLGATDSININHIKYPHPVAEVYNNLVTGVGKPNQVMDNSSPDLMNITGLERTIMWEGYHTSLSLFALFGPGTSWHQVRVNIKSRHFEDMPEQEMEQ